MTQEVLSVGLLDKIKGMVSVKKSKAKHGVHAAADQVEKVVPDAHDDKVDKAAEAAKDAIDKLD